MSVYVDDARIFYGRMRMSHMIADSTAELLSMALSLGLERRWLQHAGKRNEHFDVCWAKRSRAINLGAIPVTTKELVAKLREREPRTAGVDRRTQ